MTSVSNVAVPPQVADALRRASARTGADFDYLLTTAVRESGLRTDAKSKTSSATGLFQFIEETWLSTVKKAGRALGLGHLAVKIEQLPDGRHKVSDRAARQEILALRKDPMAAAMMAGAYTRDAERELEGRLGRPVSPGELYVAHFLGVGGAGQLIEAAAERPHQRADRLFPEAAAANRSIFYAPRGRPLSVAQVYQRLTEHHDGLETRAATPALPGNRGQAAHPVVSPAAARYLAPADVARNEARPANWNQQLFSSAAQTSGGRQSSGPLVLDSAAVPQLWELGRAPTEAPPQPSAEMPPRPAHGGLLGTRRPVLDLFRTE